VAIVDLLEKRSRESSVPPSAADEADADVAGDTPPAYVAWARLPEEHGRYPDRTKAGDGVLFQ
jgi:hypothetical protein